MKKALQSDRRGRLEWELLGLILGYRLLRTARLVGPLEYFVSPPLLRLLLRQK